MKKTWIILALVATFAAFGFTPSAQAGTVVGVVIDADGNSVAGAMVGIRGEMNDRRERPHHDRVETGRDGTFEFDDVPAGNYMIMAGHPDHGMVRDEFAIREDGAVRISLELAEHDGRGGDGGGRGGDDDDEVEAGWIVGTVITPDGDGVADARVEIAPMHRRGDRRVRVLRMLTDEDGNFVAEVPEGRYMVRAMVRGGMAVGRIEVNADQRNRIELTLQRHDRDDRRGRGEDAGRDG